MDRIYPVRCWRDLYSRKCDEQYEHVAVESRRLSNDHGHGLQCRNSQIEASIRGSSSEIRVGLPDLVLVLLEVQVVYGSQNEPGESEVGEVSVVVLHFGGEDLRRPLSQENGREEV